MTPHSATARTPRAVMDDIMKQISFASRSAAQKTMTAMGRVAGKHMKSATAPRQIVLQLINNDNSARTLARRICILPTSRLYSTKARKLMQLSKLSTTI